MTTITINIVQRLWGLCNILRDDGITYQAYVTELTYLLFLKMLQETGREDPLPTDCRWASLTGREGDALLSHYRGVLLRLGDTQKPVGTAATRAIFAGAQTALKKPANLRELVGGARLLGHLEEEQVGELGDVLVVRDAVVAQDVAERPEALDDFLGVHGEG